MFQKEIQWIIKEKYNGDTKPRGLKKDIERLKRGEPVDFIIGFVRFLGCKIDLSKKPLIPRPETEYWVQNFIEELPAFGWPAAGGKILDIFSGSGCIGIAVLKNVKNSRVDFAEIDDNNLEQIRINLKINKIPQKRYRLIKSDIFDPSKEYASILPWHNYGVFSKKNKYDYILANPPYIARSRTNKTQKSVLKYEPKKALFGGKDGLFYIRKFLKDAKKYLKPRGKIYMEFDSWQKPEIKKLLKKSGYSNFELKKDQYNKWRYIIISAT